MAPPSTDGAQWRVCAGATLLMPSGNEGDHLYVVLNNPVPFDGYGQHPCAVLVNLSSVREGVPHDATCVLEPGEHPFVAQRSFVFYRNARIERESHVTQVMLQGLFKPHAPMPETVLQRIKAGLFASPHTKREFKRFKL
jgi:hypothetical protein